MAKKLAFNVIFASDEDPEYPASELNVHGPTIIGWRCRKDNQILPQEIVLRLLTPGKICRIQVLAHQYLIPERIELWLHFSPVLSPNTPLNQNYEYLGFISLSDNSSTNFQSRELQSVLVTPQIGNYIKLRLSKPHINHLNTHGQVALIAINILGLEVTPEELNTTKNSSNITFPDHIEQSILSVCDDLSFSMYVEESVADIIREMEIKKIRAVADERFEYARKLKLCMGALKNAGERLGRYSLAKRQAVQQEDFTAARLRKEQIEIYRKSVYEQLLIDQLMEKEEIIPDNDLCLDTYATKPQLPSPPSLQDVASFLTENSLASTMSPKVRRSKQSDCISESTNSLNKQTIHSQKFNDEPPSSPQLHRIGRSPNRGSPTSTGSLRRRNKSAPRNSYEDYDERAVPALRHSQTNEFLRESQGIGLQESDITRGRAKLNDRERRQASLPILVFGNELVELFYSRQFQDREDGLSRLREYLRGSECELCSSGLNRVARASAFLLHRSIRDAVFSVFNQATETVRTLFVEFIPKGVTPSEVSRCVDRLLPELLAKTGDPSARIHTLSQHTILSIAACLEVREQNLIAPSLSRSVGSGTHPRLALSRMQMLEQLVLSQGISIDKQSGLTCRSLSESGCSGIHHPAESVRKVAERVLLLVYKVNPRLVRKQLPPDDDITRRNLLYRQLFNEFDKLDFERKKDMLDANKHNAEQDSDSFSPSLVNNSKFSPLFDVKNKLVKNEQSSRQTTAKITAETKETVFGKIVDGTSNLSELNAQNSPKSSNSDSFEDNNEICPFCEWIYKGDSSLLDRHYWKACPILTKCPQCSQILEVAALNYHLANECEAKISYIICERCTEAVHKELYELHLEEDFCKELSQGMARCPLCHHEIEISEEKGWKEHLVSDKGCPGNIRRRSKIN